MPGKEAADITVVAPHLRTHRATHALLRGLEQSGKGIAKCSPFPILVGSDTSRHTKLVEVAQDQAQRGGIISRAH